MWNAVELRELRIFLALAAHVAPQALPARGGRVKGTPGRRRALPGPGRCSELSPPKEPDGV